MERRRSLELPARATEVPLDGSRRHPELVGDRTTRATSSDQQGDALFDRRQIGDGHQAPFVDASTIAGAAYVSLTAR
jgi:hypothetical protein